MSNGLITEKTILFQGTRGGLAFSGGVGGGGGKDVGPREGVSPAQFHVGHLYMPWFALPLTFLCLPGWTNAMSAAILFLAND